MALSLVSSGLENLNFSCMWCDAYSLPPTVSRGLLGRAANGQQLLRVWVKRVLSVCHTYGASTRTSYARRPGGTAFALEKEKRRTMFPSSQQPRGVVVSKSCEALPSLQADRRGRGARWDQQGPEENKNIFNFEGTKHQLPANHTENM